MKKQFLVLKQLDRQFDTWREISLLPKPLEGWVRTIRKALGMTTKQLAKRLKLSRSRIVKIEQAEPEGAIAVSTLEAVAKALNCKLVYALVPIMPLRTMIEQQAKNIAEKRLNGVAHSMLLEEQSVDARAQQEQLVELVNELLSASFKKLWENE